MTPHQTPLHQIVLYGFWHKCQTAIIQFHTNIKFVCDGICLTNF